MGAPPGRARQESPLEVLARIRLELIEVSSREVDRDDAWAFGDDVRNAQPVVQRGRDRLAHPEREDQDDHRRVQQDPVGAGERVVHEIGADDELVRRPEHDRQVCVQVEAVPGLVREPSACPAHGADGHEDEQPERCHRHEDERVGRDHRPRLRDDRRVARGGETDRREHAVGDEQPDRREAEPAVPDGESVHPEGAVEPRAA